MSAARILVVDDEVDIRGLLQDILSDWKGINPSWDFTPNPDIQMLMSFYTSLQGTRRQTALEFVQYLAEKQLMEKRRAEGDPSEPGAGA